MQVLKIPLDKNLIIVGTAILTFFCMIYFTIAYLPKDEMIQPPTVTQNNTSFGQFYINSLVNEVSKKKNNDFPLYTFIQIHEKNTDNLEKEGFSREFFDQVFQRWMLEKYGLKYVKNQSVVRNSEGYVLYVGPGQNLNYSFEIVDKLDRTFIVARPQDSRLEHIQRVKNFVLPRPKNIRFNIKEKDAGYFSIKPTLIGNK